MMVSVLSFTIGFFCGFAALAIPLAMWFYHVNKKQSKIVGDAKKTAKANKETVDKAAESMRKIEQITQLQQELVAQQQGPSKGSLHAKHKNVIAGKVKELEKEKIQELNNIVNLGLDPTIVTLNPNTGVKQEFKLSEFLKMSEAQFPPEEPTRQKPNLQLVGGKNFDRDDDDGSDTTFH